MNGIGQIQVVFLFLLLFIVVFGFSPEDSERHIRSSWSSAAACFSASPPASRRSPLIPILSSWLFSRLCSTLLQLFLDALRVERETAIRLRDESPNQR